MGGRAGGGELCDRLRRRAEIHDPHGRGSSHCTGALLRAAADRIGALEAALAEQIGRCAGCGGSGWADVGREMQGPCPYCRGARRVLEEES